MFVKQNCALDHHAIHEDVLGLLEEYAPTAGLLNDTKTPVDVKMKNKLFIFFLVLQLLLNGVFLTTCNNYKNCNHKQ